MRKKATDADALKLDGYKDKRIPVTNTWVIIFGDLL